MDSRLVRVWCQGCVGLVSLLEPFDESPHDHDRHKNANAGDDRGDSVYPLERIAEAAGFLTGLVESLLESEKFHLLEDILGLEGAHTRFMFDGGDGVG